MVQERCILPVKCRDCDAIFDLWYDLQAQEQLKKTSQEGLVSFEKRFSSLLKQQSLCWNCRKRAIMSQMDETAEYEMEIEFE